MLPLYAEASEFSAMDHTYCVVPIAGRTVTVLVTGALRILNWSVAVNVTVVAPTVPVDTVPGTAVMVRFGSVVSPVVGTA